MGTPDFAVAPLRALMDAGHDIAGVVTMPDKPAGRGQVVRPSAVKVFAEQNGLPVLQPPKLKDEKFVEALRSLRADLQVVVAFRMLPEVVWAMPPMGTINVHASLLPNYRGAAPINWAIINGEKQTGVSTFLLKHDIDTGDILLQEAVDILDSDDAGTIHDKLMHLGARLAVETVDVIARGEAKPKRQDDINPQGLRHAPKIFKEDMKIDWGKPAREVVNLIRGLSPYPTAWTTFADAQTGETTAKIFKAHATTSDTPLAAGRVRIEGGRRLLVGTADSPIEIVELQLSGKRRMTAEALLNGFRLGDEARCIY